MLIERQRSMSYLIHSSSFLDEVVEFEKIEGLLIEHWRALEWLTLIFMKLNDKVDEFTTLWRLGLIENGEFHRGLGR